MKNLDGALRVLQGVAAPIDFHIYGPAEDKAYWNLCEQEMRKLPAHISATYCGPIAHGKVAAVMRSHDVFFLPTRGENFGHVIAEAPARGLPRADLQSDRLPQPGTRNGRLGLAA